MSNGRRGINKTGKPARAYEVKNWPLDIPLDDPSLDFPFFLRVKSSRVGDSRWNYQSICAALDVSVTQWRMYTSGHTNMPVEKIVLLYNHTQDDDILQYIGVRTGIQFFKPPDVAGHYDTIEACAAAMKEAGEAVQVILDAARDGKITKEEWLRIEREHPEAMQALAVLFHCAKLMHEGKE